MSIFDGSFNWDELNKEIEDLKENGQGDYEDVPFGDYEVSIEKMELTKSKTGDDMATIWFKIINGKYKGQRIFYNQVLNKAFQVHILHQLLKGLVADDIKIEYHSKRELESLLEEIHEYCGNYEYALAYKKGKKNKNADINAPETKQFYGEYAILECFEK